MTIRGLATSLVFAAINAPGCGQTDHPARWDGSIDTLASGMVRTVNPARGIWNTENEWHLEEDLRIGSLDGGPDEFDRIADLEVDDWGRIYLLLDRRAEIRVFDERGEYVRSFGRRGRGPGELRAPISLDIDSLGRIWVTDRIAIRYSVFDSTGSFRFSQDRHSHFSPHGGVAGDRIGAAEALFDADVHATAPSVFEYRFFKLDAYFTPIDTIVVAWFNRTPSTDVSPAPPYAPRTLYFLDPRGYVWSGVSKVFHIYMLAFTGDTVRSIARDFEPRPITYAERAAIAEARQRGNAEIGLPGSAISSQIPAHKPAMARLVVDSRGYLWVAQHGKVDGEANTFDVFDADGRYLGQATTDFSVGIERSAIAGVERGTPIIIRGDHLYGVTFDGLDVPYVVRARIERSR